MSTLVVTPPMLKPSEPGLSGASAAALLRKLGASAHGVDASIEWHRFVLDPDRLRAAWERARVDGPLAADTRSAGAGEAADTRAAGAGEAADTRAAGVGEAADTRAAGVGEAADTRAAGAGSERRRKTGSLDAMGRAVRAFGRVPVPLERLHTYQERARYSTAVADLEQALRLVALPFPNVRLGVAMYALSDGRRLESSAVLAELAATAGPFDEYFTAQLLPRVERERVDRVAISLTFQQQGPAAFRLAELLRVHLPGVERVLGGPLVACWQPLGVDFSREPFSLFDRVMAGTDDDLRALAQQPAGRLRRADAAGTIAAAETSGGPLGARGVDEPHASADPAGMGGPRAGDEPHASADPAGMGGPRAGDLDELPWSLYLAPRPVVPAAFGRGCYWRRCTFCPDHLHPGHRSCSQAGVTRFLHEVAARFPEGAMVHWTDSALPIGMLEHVAETIRRDRLPIGWHGFVRVEPALARPELADRLALGGCTMLQLGVETGSPRLLELLGKGGNPELTRAVLRATAAAGIRNQIYLLFGVPTETAEDREQTLTLVDDVADSISAINPALLNLPRGSRMHQRPDAFGITEIVPFGAQTDLSLYDDFRCGASHPRVEARRWLAHRFFKAPSVRRIRSALRVPFKANHLCFIGPE